MIKTHQFLQNKQTEIRLIEVKEPGTCRCYLKSAFVSKSDTHQRPIIPAFFHSYGTNLSLMTEETLLMS